MKSKKMILEQGQRIFNNAKFGTPMFRHAMNAARIVCRYMENICDEQEILLFSTNDGMPAGVNLYNLNRGDELFPHEVYAK